MAPARSISDQLSRHALAKPEAWQDQPWEEDRVAKVRKKIFVFLPSDDAGSLGVKVPHFGGYALTLPCATPMAYGLGKHGWVTIRLGQTSCPAVPLLFDWIDESYAAIAPVALVRLAESAKQA
jgi:predicted DNA-binding protein (MmcQ/YjbR family)